jgi:hypothetical protein
MSADEPALRLGRFFAEPHRGVAAMVLDRGRFAHPTRHQCPGLRIKKERERSCIPLPFCLCIHFNQAFLELFQQKKLFRFAGNLSATEAAIQP